LYHQMPGRLQLAFPVAQVSGTFRTPWRERVPPDRIGREFMQISLYRPAAVAALAILTTGPELPAAAADEIPASVSAISPVDALPITSDDVRPHIERLAGPEMSGRKGRDKLKSASYLQKHFEECGLLPLFGDSYRQAIPGSRPDGDPDAAPPVIGFNVGAWIPGSDPELRDQFVMITAHYDHLGMKDGRHYPGADDNASGVSMMLETARSIAQRETKPRCSIVFVGFDLEEHLLWGSRWFAAHPPWKLTQVRLLITADMIGRSLGDLPLSTVFVLGAERAPALRSVLESAECPAGLEILTLGADLIGTRSDYGPFRDRQVPFLFFSTGEHPDYHTPRDTPDRVDYEKVARISTLILRIVLEVADTNEAPQWTDAPMADLAEARTVHRVTELVLAADEVGDYELNALQRLFVGQLHAKTGNAIRLGRLTPPEREWLQHSTRLLLLSVF
jgi:hypothetical protein